MDRRAMISIQRVSRFFGPVRAVEDVNFDILDGEFFSLLGPSGCGKTTLLRILAGFEKLTAGEVVIDGIPMSSVPANRRPTNMVFQNYAIFPHLNVRQNIGYGLRHKGLTKSKLSAVVDEALATIKLSEFGSRLPPQLSGGQKQRVALARALVMRPKVLLLDEPMAALDKKLREEMQIELRQIQKEVGITFVLVTHDQEEALTMSDRIAVMSAGRVLQIDNPNRLYESPNCREVAEFIGTINLIEGTLLESNGPSAVVDGKQFGMISVNRPDGTVLKQPSRVTVAIRPEKMHITRKKPNQTQNAFQGRIVSEVYLGDRKHYHVMVDGATRRIAVSCQNVIRNLEVGNELEKLVWLSWTADAGMLFATTES